MPKIKCQAKHCAYNTDGGCGLCGISVSGRDAEFAAETCCDSFTEKLSSRDTVCECRDVSRINCDAAGCEHNAHGNCAADKIEVCGCDACECEQTKCETFKK